MNDNNGVSITEKCSVFVFPHQDDEFGVLSAIAHELRKGRNVWCVYFTDGGREVERRNHESLRVLQRIGVHPKQVLFQGQKLEIKDSTLVHNLDIATNWFLPFLRSLGDIERIYVPAWEGGHPDHDALHVLTVVVANSLAQLDLVHQFSLYNACECRAPFFRVMSPIDGNGLVVQQVIPRIDRLKYIWMCLGYPSQAISWLGLFPFVAYAYLVIGRQSFQKVSLERLYVRPHDGLLYYENRGFATWDNMQEIIHEYLLTYEGELCLN